MNIIGLMDGLELYTMLQDLKKLGLTPEEIEGFVEFEWDPLVSKSLVMSVLERKPND